MPPQYALLFSAAFLLLSSLSAAPLTFSLDIASPTLPATAFTTRDILLRGPAPYRSVALPHPNDALAGYSFGNDPVINPLFFSVDRVAAGNPASRVRALSSNPAIGGANAHVFVSRPPFNSNAKFASPMHLGLEAGFLGDDMDGLSLLPFVDHVYFLLTNFSPSLAGRSAANIYLDTPSQIFARHDQIGLLEADELDALVLLDRGTRGDVDDGDKALFSITSFSPSALTAGGTLSPAAVYITEFSGSFGEFASAASLGLRADDELHSLATVVPEPGSFLLTLPTILLVVRRLRRRTRQSGQLP